MKDLTLTIKNDATFENNESIVITWIVTLTRMENGSHVILSEEETRRLIWNNMTETTVTILDDDGMLLYSNTLHTLQHMSLILLYACILS